MGGDDVPVDHRLPGQHAGHDLDTPARRVWMGEQVGLEFRLCGEEPIRGHRRDGLARGGHAEPLGELPADPQRRLGRHHPIRGPALGDGPPEQALGAGHGQERADAHRARRLAEDRDVVGIAAECGDVVPDPFEGGDLVEQAEVGGAVLQVEEALGTDPVVDRHADDAVAGEAAAVIRRPGPDLEHPARDPDHDRQAGRSRTGRPDVEVQAVLTGDGRVRDHGRDRSGRRVAAAAARGRRRARRGRRSMPRAAAAAGADSRRTVAPRTGCP